MEKYSIGIMTIKDQDYPKNLLHIYDAPAILYYNSNDVKQHETRKR